MRRASWRAFLVFAVLTFAYGCAASVPLLPMRSMQELDYGGAEQFVDVDGQRVAYVVQGEGAETLVFVHPWAGSVRVWDAIVPAFIARYRVVVVDLPGHGKSAKPDTDYTIDLAARAVVGVMDQVGVERATLIGNSMGGAVALAVVRDHPDRVEKLVLIDALGAGPVPGLFGFFIEEFFQGPMFAGVDDGLIEFFANHFVFEQTTEHSDTFVSDLLSSRAAGDGYGYSGAVSSYLRGAVDYDATPWLGAITAPTLIVWGDGDWILWLQAAEHLDAHIPNTTLVVLEDCGHMPEVERPDALIAALVGFLGE